MSRDPLAAVTDTQVETFQQDGVIHLKGVVDRDWLAKL